MPASISFTRKKRKKPRILVEKTHPTPKSKISFVLKDLGWLHHLQTRQENSSIGIASHLFQKNLSGEAFKVWNRWMKAFGAAWGGKELPCPGCSPLPDLLLAPQFGDSQQLRLVRILRSTVMVRVGGGWMALDEFLVKNDPCRGKARCNQSLLTHPGEFGCCGWVPSVGRSWRKQIQSKPRIWNHQIWWCCS